MLAKSKTLLSIVLMVAYFIILAAFVQFFIYPGVDSKIKATVWQIISTLLFVAPIFYLQPELFKLFRTSLKVVLLGLSLFLGAVIAAVALQDQSLTAVLHNIVRQAFTGPAEELLFRGYIWQKSLEFKNSIPFAVAINIITFLVVHIPYYVAQAIPLYVFFSLIPITLLFIYIRIRTKGLMLPSFVHAAINMIT